ncbi:MAG: CDP-diacylglycerol--serine O-phosphatidyltransferase [Deltaproteobacteria bacterium]|nr:CDP-diacylglycerol--serine O-phosphatidyltransferase [Deltaproteobacteria bacterium]
MRFNLGKALFVLPNAFTVSSICCGIYSIILASGDPTSDQLFQAAIAIFFGVFFDAMDGRVARLTRTQSDFGVELDSLADVVTFGVAPAILVYKWGLEPLGRVAIVAVVVFACCGALRLARFNVLAHRSHGGTSEHFIGLPIPLAACTIVSLVIAHHSLGSGEVARHGSVLAIVLVLSYLMVSNVRYRTFKGGRLPVKPLIALSVLLVALATACALLRVSPSLMLVALCGIYILLGLFEEVLFFRRRREEDLRRRQSAQQQEPALPAVAETKSASETAR